MRKFLTIFLLLAFVALAGFVYWRYFFVFSEGNREGILNKYSTKGTVFKTNEGELLMPGVVPTMNQLSNNFFYFSVADPAVSKILEENTGKKVKLHYIQYNGSLPWRGDDYNGVNKEAGQYIVNSAEAVQ